MIRISNIHKSFHEGTTVIRVLEDFSLEIPEKQFLVIIGANGSGKSTLLNILAGTVFPESGKIKIGETELSKLPEYKRSNRIARIFQDPKMGTASELSLLENFRLAFLRNESKTLRIGTGKDFRKLVGMKVSTLNLGLEQKLDQPMGTFSGGQRQALTLLMAVMTKPGILLLDEPTAALDPKTSVNIMETADRIIRETGLTAILVTHQVKDAVRYGDRLIQLSEGKIIRDIAGNEKKTLAPEQVLNWFS